MIHTCAQCGTENRIPAGKLHLHARCGGCKAPICPIDRPHPVRSSAEFEEVVTRASLPVLVDFGASWCGPCRAVAPELEKIARDRSGRLLVMELDTDELPDVAARYAVRSLPTFVLIEHGGEARRTMGAMLAGALLGSLGL
jgi:thioredoxin 2